MSEHEHANPPDGTNNQPPHHGADTGNGRSGDGACGCDCHAGGYGGVAGAADAGRVPPAGDGVAPFRSKVGTIDWSGGPDAAALGRLLDECATIDRHRARQVEALIRTVEEGAAEGVLGVPVEVVLAQTGRATRFETSRLLRAARMLSAMPAVRSGLQQGWLSWPQVDAICHLVDRDVPRDRWNEIDALVGDRAVAQAAAEADGLVDEVEWQTGKIAADQRQQRKSKPVEDNQTWFDQRLDGSGDIHASYDSEHFPLMAERIEGVARGIEDVPDIPDDEDLPDAALTDAARQAAKIAGRNAAARGAALFELVTGLDCNILQPTDDDNRGSGRPSVLLTTQLDSLLDGSTPALVLNRLAGRIRVTADAARRWVDALGADVRLTVFDDGQPVGVGRRTEVPPGWLRDAIVARDVTDTAPCSSTSALLCDIDHTVPYDDGGPTDVDNLAVVSRRWHTRKTNRQLELTRTDGRVATWTATKSGYQVITWPSPHLDDPERDNRLTPPGLRRLQELPPADLDDTEQDFSSEDRHDADGRAPP